MNASSTLHARYDTLVHTGAISDDLAQRTVLSALEALDASLGEAPKPRGIMRLLRPRKAAATAPSSLYIWGNVGRGKSMLMDLFFTHAPVAKKRRVHFHAFMQEVHARIHQIRKDGAGDPVATLARAIAHETSLLCFDELQATDVADATLLFRLFSALFETGVTVVSTSNHPPASLYTGGVQRERFAKFIALVEQRMQVMPLSSPRDYRMTQMRSLRKAYMWPLGTEAEHFIADALSHLCADVTPKEETLMVQGRPLRVRVCDQSVGLFSFRELCEIPLGAADYLAVAQRFDTIVLTRIPKLPPEKRNEAKRFVTLIDALYEHRVKLLTTAACPVQEIYSEGDGAFEFARTVSRLMEMQSEKWMNNG